MAAPIKTTDVIAIGLMTFALFLGAGNMIFPPYLGQVAGSDFIPAVAGFLLTGVGLPLLGVVAAARLGGGLNSFTQDLPRWLALLVGLALYLAIGPLFAAPRTGVVAWEMSLAELFAGHPYGQMIYTLVFFGATLWLAMFPGRLIETIGKIITPLLVLVLAAIGAGVFIAPLGELSETTAIQSGDAFSWGFQQGYQTMDTLASLAFGIVIITALRDRGVSAKPDLTRYTITAGCIAAVGLATVYVTLAVLGATSHTVLPNAQNGADILTTYITSLFGPWGMVLLGVSITLACLTTAVGLMTACGEYFNESFPIISYRGYVLLCTLVSALIANIGLNQLLELTIPALLIIYPVAITLICLALLRTALKQPGFSYALTLLPVFVVSLVDGLSASGVQWAEGIAGDYLAVLPLHQHSLGWLLPGVVGLLISLTRATRAVKSEAE